MTSTHTDFEVSFKAPMGYVVGLPLVASLGVRDVLSNTYICWPHGVVDSKGTKCADVKVSVQYNEGFVATISLTATNVHNPTKLKAAVCARIQAWETAIANKQAQAGPLAPVLLELFDALWLLDQEVQCVYPNGRIFATGRLAAIDVWGKISVILADGQELELAPEQAGIQPVGGSQGQGCYSYSPRCVDQLPSQYRRD